MSTPATFIDPITISLIWMCIEAGVWLLVKIVRRWRRRRVTEERTVLRRVSEEQYRMEIEGRR